MVLPCVKPAKPINSGAIRLLQAIKQRATKSNEKNETAHLAERTTKGTRSRWESELESEAEESEEPEEDADEDEEEDDHNDKSGTPTTPTKSPEVVVYVVSG